jgi:hypothetical protein
MARARCGRESLDVVNKVVKKMGNSGHVKREVGLIYTVYNQATCSHATTIRRSVFEDSAVQVVIHDAYRLRPSYLSFSRLPHVEHLVHV